METETLVVAYGWWGVWRLELTSDGQGASFRGLKMF